VNWNGGKLHTMILSGVKCQAALSLSHEKWGQLKPLFSCEALFF